MSSTIKDRNITKPPRIASPVTGAFAVTPNDSTDLAEVTLSLYVSVSGALKATLYDGSVVTYANLTAGRHPLRVKRVWATGTAATGIVGEV
jgi:hypothetical protein